MRAFLDANVLFSACNLNSGIFDLVFFLIEKDWAVTSELALEETQRNLLRKKPNWIPTFAQLSTSIKVVTSISFELSVQINEKDLPLLCTAIHSRCDYFVTGDKYDFGHLYGQSVDGVKIVTVGTLAEAVAERVQC